MPAEDAFEILPCSERAIPDETLESLLWRTYVDEGFTAREVASVAFAADAVRARGEMFVAWRAGAVPEAVGMVIVVPPTSRARRIAGPNEVEMHLLAVDARQRGHGVGRRLVERAIVEARRMGGSQMVLWTEEAMRAARHVYASCGFTRAEARDREISVLSKKEFIVYQRAL